MGEVRISTGWLGADVEIRFEGQVTGKVEIREVGQEWTDIEKVEGMVTQPLSRPLRSRLSHPTNRATPLRPRREKGN